MVALTSSSLPRFASDPWFRQRPRFTATVIAGLFLAVFTVRLLVHSVDAYSMFYVLPVALAAVTFGLRGGCVAALLAVTLIVVWTVVDDVSLGLGGWATRVVPVVLLGLLLGDATDRARRAEDERQQLERAALLHREAIEINDCLVQRMAAAKWSFEAGQVAAGLQALTVAITDAQYMVSGLIRRAGMGERAEHVPTTPEDQLPRRP